MTVKMEEKKKVLPDFKGWATKAGIVCDDGKTIAPGAFRHQDQQTVPLVYQHQHSDVKSVLGHAILTAVGDDVWAEAYFNSTPEAQHAKELVRHGDIRMLSIWANNLMMRGKTVIHGAIRELSLVLAGANRGATIEEVSIEHSAGYTETLDDEAIIYTGLEFEVVNPEESISHASDGEDDSDAEDDTTLGDVYETLNDDQKKLVRVLVGAAKSGAGDDDEEIQQDAMGEDSGSNDDTVSNTDENVQHSTDQKGSQDMTTHTNVFEDKDVSTGGEKTQTLSHDAITSILETAWKNKSKLSDAFMAYVESDTELSHGVQNLDVLFPEAKPVTGKPEWIMREVEWVAGVLGSCSKRPFARVKSWFADLTYEESRAKGYITGNMKKEQYYSIAQRETGPQTIYKKQKIDRDDVIDITDFDMVAWIRSEMRMMLDEEIARAILVGDGRDAGDDDKIKEDKIRPVAYDDPFYTHGFSVDLSDPGSSVEEALDALVMQRQYYKGTGTPTMYTTETFIAQVLLLRDADGRKLYRSLDEVAAMHRVSRIVPVEILDEHPNIHYIVVNLADYVIGMDRGGQVTLFDDFDIDYNQMKYLIETRMCGALTKRKSAMVCFNGDGDTAVVATAPTFDQATGDLVIPVVTGVTYRDAAGNTLTGTVSVAPDTNITVQAWPDAGYYFAGGSATQTRWSFLRLPA